MFKNKKSKLSNINDLRTSAISQGSSRILTNLNIWNKIENNPWMDYPAQAAFKILPQPEKQKANALQQNHCQRKCLPTQQN